MERTISASSSHSIDDLTVSTEGGADPTRRVFPSGMSIGGGTTSSAVGSQHPSSNISLGGGTTSSAIGSQNGGEGLVASGGVAIPSGLPAGLIRRVNSQRDGDELSVTSSITGISSSDADSSIASNIKPMPRAMSANGTVIMGFPGQPPIPPSPSHQLPPGAIAGSPQQPPQYIPMAMTPNAPYPMLVPHPPGTMGIALAAGSPGVMYAGPFPMDDQYNLNHTLSTDTNTTTASPSPLSLPTFEVFREHILQMKENMYEKANQTSTPGSPGGNQQNNPHSAFVKNANRIDKLATLVLSSYQTVLTQFSRYEELIQANSDANSNIGVMDSPDEKRGRSRVSTSPRTTMPSKSPGARSRPTADSRRSISPRASSSSDQTDSHPFPSKRPISPQRASKIHRLPEPRKQPERNAPAPPKVTRNSTVGNYMSPTELGKIRSSAPAPSSKKDAADELPNFNTTMAESPFDQPLPPAKRRSLSPNSGGKFQPSSSSGLYDRASPPRGSRDDDKTSTSKGSARSSSASAASRKPASTASGTARSTSAPRPLPENSNLLRGTAAYKSSMVSQSGTGRGGSGFRPTSNQRSGTSANKVQSAQERADKLKKMADSLPATQKLKAETRGRLNKSTTSIQAKSTTSVPPSKSSQGPPLSSTGHRVLSVDEVLNQVNNRTATATPAKKSSTANAGKSPNATPSASKATKSPQSKAMQGASGRRNSVKGTAAASGAAASGTTPSRSVSRTGSKPPATTPTQSTPQGRLTSTNSQTPVASGKVASSSGANTYVSPALAAVLSPQADSQPAVPSTPAPQIKVSNEHSTPVAATTPLNNSIDDKIGALPRTGIVYEEEGIIDGVSAPHGAAAAASYNNDTNSVSSNSSQPPAGGVKILRQAFEESAHRVTSSSSVAVPHKTTSPAATTHATPAPAAGSQFVITGGKTTVIVGGNLNHKVISPSPSAEVVGPPSPSGSNKSGADIFVSSAASHSNSGSNSGTPSSTPRTSLQKPLKTTDIFGANYVVPVAGVAGTSAYSTPRNSVGRGANSVAALTAAGLNGEVKTIRGGRPSIVRAPSSDSQAMNGHNVDDVLIGPGRSSNMPDEVRKDMKRMDAADSHIIVDNNGSQNNRGVGSGSLSKFWQNLIPGDDDQPSSNIDDQPVANDDDEVY